MELLLNDEHSISEENHIIRKKLYDQFQTLPKDFFSKMRHFQPQIGCFNNCSFCSKFSVCKSEYWNIETLRNVVSAIKYSASKYTDGKTLLAFDRVEHRVGVIYPYLDNDIGGYPYIDEFVKLCYQELGVKTRISSVAFSRHNNALNEAHKKINSRELIDYLGGVRLSISQYGRAWEEKSNNVNLKEYQNDITNFLKIYKPYYEKYGPGYRKMCTEIRYNPLVEQSEVYIKNYHSHLVIATSNYLFISNEENIVLKQSHIIDPFNHSLEIDESPVMVKEYNLKKKIKSKEELEKILDNLNKFSFVKEKELYLFSNNDGIYYALDPKKDTTGNYGINIYPRTEKRKESGYIITERFLLNAIYKFKNQFGLNLRDEYKNSSWEDINKVLDNCRTIGIEYQEQGKKEKSTYIFEHVIPLITIYANALKDAGYNSDCFFDKNFTIDTGMICNLGRAIILFKNLTSFINEPITPNHERNYGRSCSTMKQENYAWRLSCGFNNTLIIEKLELFNTATVKGQVSYRRVLTLKGLNIEITEKNNKYLFPGAHI